jgi:hypothetical protein
MARTDARPTAPIAFDEDLLERLVDRSREREGLSPRVRDRQVIDKLLRHLRAPVILRGGSSLTRAQATALGYSSATRDGGRS